MAWWRPYEARKPRSRSWPHLGRDGRTPVVGGLVEEILSRTPWWIFHVMFWLTEYRVGPAIGPYLIQFWKPMMWYDSFLWCGGEGGKKARQPAFLNRGLKIHNYKPCLPFGQSFMGFIYSSESGNILDERKIKHKTQTHCSKCNTCKLWRLYHPIVCSVHWFLYQTSFVAPSCV